MLIWVAPRKFVFRPIFWDDWRFFYFKDVRLLDIGKEQTAYLALLSKLRFSSEEAAEISAELKEIIEYAVYDKDHSGAFSNHSADEFELELFPLIPFKDD